MRPHELLVLAGGFGTRLRSAVPEVPKPLAPIGGRPFLSYQIECWVAQGVRRLSFLLHHQAGLVEKFLDELRGQSWLGDCELRSVTESVPMGTGGAVAFAIDRLKISGPFLVTNADTWLGTGLAELSASAAPAIAVVQVPDSGRYGAVRTDESGRISAFDEKSELAGAGWINAGLYHLHPQLFEGWDGAAFSLERDSFPGLVAAGKLTAVPLATEFIDIGIPADYFRFCRWIEAGRNGSP